MGRAIELAARTPRMPFSTVIAHRHSGEILCEGANRYGENPVLHAEIDALNRLAALPGRADRADLQLYTTAEPCPMCCAAIIWAGIGEVYYGTSIRQLMAFGWYQIALPADELLRHAPWSGTKLVGGVMGGACDALFRAAKQPAPSPPAATG